MSQSSWACSDHVLLLAEFHPGPHLHPCCCLPSSRSSHLVACDSSEPVVLS